MNEGTTTVVTLSGGLDSTTLLYYLREQGQNVVALSVDYGQRHRIELQYSARIASRLGVKHEVADLSQVSRLLAGSSQTDLSINVPHGHYAAESMKLTVVPNRNMIILAIAAGWAISLRADSVSYAAHAGDHAIYPDCREEFAEALAGAIGLADWHSVTLERPFVQMTKAEIVCLGAQLGVPFHETWSCYEGADVHCGACGTCIERREAFLLSGVSDSTPYSPSAPVLTRDRSGGAGIRGSHQVAGKQAIQGIDTFGS